MSQLVKHLINVYIAVIHDIIVPSVKLHLKDINSVHVNFIIVCIIAH